MFIDIEEINVLSLDLNIDFSKPLSAFAFFDLVFLPLWCESAANSCGDRDGFSDEPDDLALFGGTCVSFPLGRLLVAQM
jgi:hypothetical protein